MFDEIPRPEKFDNCGKIPTWRKKVRRRFFSEKLILFLVKKCINVKKRFRLNLIFLYKEIKVLFKTSKNFVSFIESRFGRRVERFSLVVFSLELDLRIRYFKVGH